MKRRGQEDEERGQEDEEEGTSGQLYKCTRSTSAQETLCPSNPI